VVIDPGHGGTDPGTSGPNGPEKNINLDTALRVRNILNAKGIRTIMTRDDDRAVDLKERPVIANKAKADLFVSIHSDFAKRNRSAHGVTVYTSRSPGSGSVELAKRMSKAFSSGGCTSRGVSEANYVVLVNTNMPAVLVEQGFLSNSADATRLASPGYRQQVAECIAQAVVAQIASR
jgi:N-acetylmuramoyl-L-alanine amidase